MNTNFVYRWFSVRINLNSCLLGGLEMDSRCGYVREEIIRYDVTEVAGLSRGMDYTSSRRFIQGFVVRVLIWDGWDGGRTPML